MDKDKLQKAYEAVEMLKALDLPVSKDQLNAIAEMERECLLEEVTPRIQKILKPIVKNMNEPTVKDSGSFYKDYRIIDY